MTERGDVGAASAALVPHAPGWQGGAGHLEGFGSLTRGEARRAPLPVRLTEACAFASIPAWLATMVAWWQGWEDGSPSDRLGQSLAFC